MHCTKVAVASPSTCTTPTAACRTCVTPRASDRCYQSESSKVDAVTEGPLGALPFFCAPSRSRQCDQGPVRRQLRPPRAIRVAMSSSSPNTAWARAESRLRAGDEAGAIELLRENLADRECALRLREWAAVQRHRDLLAAVFERFRGETHAEAKVCDAI